mgnify:CR=1 FL=1
MKQSSRKQLDKVLIGLGVIVFVALTGGGFLAQWANRFADDQIKSQLVQEKVFFPPAGSAALDPKEFPGLQKYAGQQVDNGDKAKAYADEFIWVHMMKIADGKTYSEVSELSRANPTDQKLAGQKTTLFQGDMLRSSLLTAYAFSRFGLIAQYAMYVFFGAAAVMALLIALGVFHLRSLHK